MEIQPLASDSVNCDREEFDTLKDIVSRLQTTISQQGEKIKQLEGEMKVSKETSGTTQNETKQRNSGTNRIAQKRNTDSTVAFFATLTRAPLDQRCLNENILFEDVVTYFGNAYNNRLGVFVAPVSGLYLITTSVLSRQNREFWAAVVVNGTEIVHLNGRGTDNRHGSGAQTIIIALKKGMTFLYRTCIKAMAITGERNIPVLEHFLFKNYRRIRLQLCVK